VALALLLGRLGVFGALDAKVFIMMSALPPAVYNYLLAERLGGDVASASRIILGSTLLSFASIPVMLWLLG
jgi:predicted permease